MRLPESLRERIEKETSQIPARDLAAAAARLSEAYRRADFTTPVLKTAADRAAYLSVRLPATYAVCSFVLAELRRLAPELQVHSMLDLGAGPGTATLAAIHVFPELRQQTLLERDAAMLDAAKLLVGASGGQERDYIVADLVAASFQQHDLIVLCYALGELSRADRQRVVEQAWAAASKILVVIEAGTPLGFRNVLGVRAQLAQGYVVAPCPRSEPHQCPMDAANDWCHFAERLERTSLHRQLKGGELGYEDEKFSYVILSRQPLPTASARVLRHPAKHSGFVELQLCTPQGLQKQTIARSQKDAYKRARKVEWGEAW